MRRRPIAWIVPALALSLMGTAAAARLVRAHGVAGDEPGNPTSGVKYDGKFVFVRLRYDMPHLPKGLFVGSEVQSIPWSHDLPDAERNLMKILEAVTFIDPYMGPEGGKILSLYDPELFKFPIAYMSEPGFWVPDEGEVAGLRSYLLKGGFLIFDDFRESHWYNLEAQMQRVLPEGRWVELDARHPIFNAFFEIADPGAFTQMYDPERGAVFHGIFEDNDPGKRLMVVANYNNDIGEYWQYSNTGWVPIDLSNEAYKFGVNYMIYGMTH